MSPLLHALCASVVIPATLSAADLALRDGRTLRKEVEYARGNAAYPLHDGELLTKFEGCLAYGGVTAPAAALYDALIHVDQVGGTADLYRLG